jgi:hypothetical protein
MANPISKQHQNSKQKFFNYFQASVGTVGGKNNGRLAEAKPIKLNSTKHLQIQNCSKTSENNRKTGRLFNVLSRHEFPCADLRFNFKYGKKK